MTAFMNSIAKACCEFMVSPSQKDVAGVIAAQANKCLAQGEALHASEKSILHAQQPFAEPVHLYMDPVH